MIFTSQNLRSCFYWDVKATDGLFEQNSSNGPFLLYCFVSEDPANNSDTYLDLFISDWYIGYRSSPTYNAAVELYNPKKIRLIYLIIFFDEHKMEVTGWRLAGLD